MVRLDECFLFAAIGYPPDLLTPAVVILAYGRCFGSVRLCLSVASGPGPDLLTPAAVSLAHGQWFVLSRPIAFLHGGLTPTVVSFAHGW